MAMDARERWLVRDRFDDAIGPEATDLVMEEFAVLGQEQVDIRHEIELLRRDMQTGFERLRADMFERFDTVNERFDERFARQSELVEERFRQLLFSMLGVMLTIAVIAFGAARLG